VRALSPASAAWWLGLAACGPSLPPPDFSEPLASCDHWPEELWQAPGFVIHRCEPQHLVLSGPGPLSSASLWEPRLVAQGWTVVERLDGPTQTSAKLQRGDTKLVLGTSQRADVIWVGLTLTP
jgi:hypothetical protein